MFYYMEILFKDGVEVFEIRHYHSLEKALEVGRELIIDAWTREELAYWDYELEDYLNTWDRTHRLGGIVEIHEVVFSDEEI